MGLFNKKGFTPLEIPKTPEQKAKSLTGFTLVEIMVAVAIIGLLAVIAIPSFVKARTVAYANACINNMRQIDHAIHRWAMEHQKNTGEEVIESEVEEYLKGGIPNCPAGGTYTTTTVGGPVSCSIPEHGTLATSY